MRTLVVAAVAAATFATSAQAALTVSGSVGGAPSGAIRENFDTLPLGATGGTTPTNIGVAFTPDAAAVTGSLADRYAAPFLSGNNGAGFGPGGTDQPDGPDLTTYLAAGSSDVNPGANITFTLPGLQRYFGLLWGSVDDFNTLSFFAGDTLIGSVTGSDVTASPNGDQGVNGTLYVNITSTTPFDRVVATSTTYTFEIDNVAISERILTPAPAAAALFGLGLIGIAAARRRG